MIVYLNGRFVSDKKATISIFDRGFLYGDGVYETLRAYNGKVFLLREHLQRLNESLLGIRLPPPISLMDVGHAVRRVVRMNRHRDAAVRVIITRGPGPYGFDPRTARAPTVLVTSTPFDARSLERTRRGVTAAVVSIRRSPPSTVPPSVKSTNCLNGILARMEARELGAREGLMLTPDNWITEGSVSNVFIVHGGRVLTPAADGSILPGVTREWVMVLARSEGIPVEEDRVPLPELVSAEEVFVTSTLMEIAPVTRVIYNVTSRPREVPVGNGRPGPVTRRLIGLFRKSVRKL